LWSSSRPSITRTSARTRASQTPPGAELKLEICAPGAAAQIWEIVPADDSGQFELHRKFGDIDVEEGKITTDGTGYVGRQTKRFA